MLLNLKSSVTRKETGFQKTGACISGDGRAIAWERTLSDGLGLDLCPSLPNG